MKENVNREDCQTQVANIADLRAFRAIAMSAYDDAVERGVRPSIASVLAIDITYLMNESNNHEKLYEVRINKKIFHLTAEQCNTAYNVMQSLVMLNKR